MILLLGGVVEDHKTKMSYLEYLESSKAENLCMIDGFYKKNRSLG